MYTHVLVYICTYLTMYKNHQWADCPRVLQ